MAPHTPSPPFTAATHAHECTGPHDIYCTNIEHVNSSTLTVRLTIISGRRYQFGTLPIEHRNTIRRRSSVKQKRTVIMLVAKNKRLVWFSAIPAVVVGVTATAFGLGTKLGFHGGDGRLTTATGDWAPGDNKGECGGTAPYMVGVAKPSNNNSYTDAILCYNSIPSWTYNAVGGITLSNLRNADSRRDTA
jgi:hypothetical protein